MGEQLDDFEFKELEFKGEKDNQNEIKGWLRKTLKSPIHCLIYGFIFLIVIGAILLMMPFSTHEGLGVIEAIFTATSASCVTGLAVVDTGTAFTKFGQIVILCLIQVGGLGIMTISTFLIIAVGGRVSFSSQVILCDSYDSCRKKKTSSLLLEIFLFTFIIEAIGAIILFFNYQREMSASKAFFYSVFHSVSAFCNAGFALQANSFESYHGNLIVNMTLMALILCGGIGFLVLSELKNNIPLDGESWNKLTLHSKLSLQTTVYLIIFGFFFFLFIESNNSMSQLSVSDKFLASLFQSVSARTAGFNTISINNMADVSLFVLMLLMFVGACPGSCGGGIKTTTLAGLFIIGWSKIKGHSKPTVFNRSLSDQSVNKAIIVTMISFFIVLIASTLLLITELGGASHQSSNGKFLEIIFEIVSAFGTVGLSTGITASLSVFGKLLITVIMFIGRLGPLTIAMAIASRNIDKHHLAEENILIG